MEIAQTAINNNNTTTGLRKPSSPEEGQHETETPSRIQNTTAAAPVAATAKAPPFSNGVLKRHHNHVAAAAANNNNQQQQVLYKECLKNHAAALGGHALDGCGEFMPAPTATPADPTSLKCAACGCHRNFHRREPEDPVVNAAIEFQSHHRHQPLPPAALSPGSPSPPPISSSYYPHHHLHHHHPAAGSAPHMLLALSGGGIAAPPESTAGPLTSAMVGSPCRKRFRTKFSLDQKEKMHKFAESVGWKMQKRDDELVREFCSQIGVDRSVLKVWMHNNKNTFAKRDSPHSNANGNASVLAKTLSEEHNAAPAPAASADDDDDLVPDTHTAANGAASS